MDCLRHIEWRLQGRSCVAVADGNVSAIRGDRGHASRWLGRARPHRQLDGRRRAGLDSESVTASLRPVSRSRKSTYRDQGPERELRRSVERAIPPSSAPERIPPWLPTSPPKNPETAPAIQATVS